eukprot:1066692-Alexandrium_andersonii.AAC.1
MITLFNLLCSRAGMPNSAARNRRPLPGIFASQTAQSAIRNPLKACQRCTPPQSAIRPTEHAVSLQ